MDPRVVLASRLNHGLGEDLLDSPLVRDSVNADLLLKARLGVDSATLMRELGPASEAAARADALIAASLLRREGSLFRTTVPIVVGADRAWYDSVTRAWAVPSLREVQAPLDTLLQQISSRGWQAWTYHFVWSQVFDSQRLWATIQRTGVTPPLNPSVTWVIYPEHPAKSGTNLFPGRIETAWFLSVTWTPAHRTQLGKLEAAADTLIAVVTGQLISDSARASLRSLGLLGPDGEPAVPVLRADDPLFGRVRALAEQWSEAVRRSIDIQLVAGRLGIDPGVAWAMTYHDLSWSALERLIDLGAVPPIPASGFVPPGHGSAVLIPADSLFLATLLPSAARGGPDRSD